MLVKFGILEMALPILNIFHASSSLIDDPSVAIMYLYTSNPNNLYNRDYCTRIDIGVEK